MITGVKVGDVIGDRYRVEQVLGAGAMGVVVSARHIQLDDPVAIKFLAAELLENPTALGRFDREARAAARIKHEHVIRVYDVGKLPSGVPYLVMEQLTGCDLATLLHNDGPLRLDQAVDFVRQACSGIAEAHRLGVVHRDIKPSNLFCVRRSDQRLNVKVLDFGISKLIEPAPNGAITGTTSLLGSPSYMSPEQMRAPNRVDHRTDIWSLGVVLYELSTGALPFEGSSYAELCLSVTTDMPEPPRARCPELPTELENIVLKCLQKNRDERYANVGELDQALEAFAARGEHSAHRPRVTSNVESPPTLTAPSPWVEAPALPESSTAGKSTWAQTVAPLVRLPRRHQLLFAGLLVAVVTGVALIWRSSAAPEPATTARTVEPAGPVRAGEVPARAPLPPAPMRAAATARSETTSVPATPPTPPPPLPPTTPASVSIRALRTAPPAASLSAPVATGRPIRPAKPRATAVPVQRSQSSVWTERE